MCMWGIPWGLTAKQGFKDSKSFIIATLGLWLCGAISSIEYTILPKPLSHGGLVSAFGFGVSGRWWEHGAVSFIKNGLVRLNAKFGPKKVV